MSIPPSWLYITNLIAENQCYYLMSSTVKLFFIVTGYTSINGYISWAIDFSFNLMEPITTFFTMRIV